MLKVVSFLETRFKIFFFVKSEKNKRKKFFKKNKFYFAERGKNNVFVVLFYTKFILSHFAQNQLQIIRIENPSSF